MVLRCPTNKFVTSLKVCIGFAKTLQVMESCAKCQKNSLVDFAFLFLMLAIDDRSHEAMEATRRTSGH